MIQLRRRSRKIIVLAILGVVIIGLVLVYNDRIFASEGDAVYGWAWSDNIGWISFNSLNPASGGSASYGVDIDWDTGYFSGFTWSENIGWIDFGPLEGYPKGPLYQVRYLPASGNLKGWARIVSLKPEGTGWISMRGPGYGVSIDEAGDFQGYAWSEDFGWISFNNDPDYKVTVKPAAFTLSENELLRNCSNLGLTWTISLGANGYSIWRDGENITPIGSCKAPDDPPGCSPYLSTDFTDTLLDELTDYSYFIRAYNKITSTDSNILDLTTPSCLPSQPRNLISVGECGPPPIIRLYWGIPARPGTSYNIYRKFATDPSYPDTPNIATGFTCASYPCMYEDTLGSGFGYTWFNYKVVAVGVAGEGDPAETSEVPCSECN